MRVSNALNDHLNNPSRKDFEDEAFDIAIYIAKGVDAEKPLSTLVRESGIALGYEIHPNTFFSFIYSLLKENPVQTLNYIKTHDDMGFFIVIGNRVLLKNTAYECYGRIVVDEPIIPKTVPEDAPSEIEISQKLNTPSEIVLTDDTIPEVPTSSRSVTPKITEPNISEKFVTVKSKITTPETTLLDNPLKVQGEPLPTESLNATTAS